jgi:short chain dehydrogenase
MPLSPLTEVKVGEWNWIIDVNIRGVLHGIAAVWPGMEARGEGHIINVSSAGGFAVQPTAAVYAATKFAVRYGSAGRHVKDWVGQQSKLSALRASRFIGIVQIEVAYDDNANQRLDHVGVRWIVVRWNLDFCR